MNDDETRIGEIRRQWHGSYPSYVWGFIFSIILTTASFLFVWEHVFGEFGLIFALLTLAVVQGAVQMFYFLHIGKDRPHWQTLLFFFMGSILLILVLGSLWIMFNLYDRVM